MLVCCRGIESHDCQSRRHGFGDLVAEGIRQAGEKEYIRAGIGCGQFGAGQRASEDDSRHVLLQLPALRPITHHDHANLHPCWMVLPGILPTALQQIQGSFRRQTACVEQHQIAFFYAPVLAQLRISVGGMELLAIHPRAQQRRIGDADAR